MPELIWLDGVVMPLAQAKVSVEDRGYQYADGVYETIRVYDGKPFALAEHLDRLERSAKAILIDLPVTKTQLAEYVRGLIAQSQTIGGTIYIQLTRGVAPRDHRFPKNARPVLLFYNRAVPDVPEPGTAPGIHLIAIEDDRWKRCWIKSLALLPNVLAKNAAIAAGGDEALLVEDGKINECSTSNFYLIRKGTLITPPVGAKVLPGITRQLLLPIARNVGLPVEERHPTIDEARQADEMFITSSTREVGWVNKLDAQVIGASRCGAVTLELHRAFQARIARDLNLAPAEQPRAKLGGACR